MSHFLANLLARSLASATPGIQPRLASRYEPGAGASRVSPEPAPTLSEAHEESPAIISTSSAPSLSANSAPPGTHPAPASPSTASTAFAQPTPALLSAPRPRPLSSIAVRPPPEAATPTATSRIQFSSTPPAEASPSAQEPARSATASGLFFAPKHTLPDSGIRPAPISPPHAPAPLTPDLTMPVPTPAAPPSDSVPRAANPAIAPAVPASGLSFPSPNTPHPLLATTPTMPPGPAAEPGIHISIGRVEIRATPPPAPPRPAAPSSSPAAAPVLPLNEYLRRRDAA